jgi:DNA-binding cell septation regulator SpoVG
MQNEILVELRLVENQKATKAYADITVDTFYGEITICGLRVIQKDNTEPWVALPDNSYKDADSQRYKHFTIIRIGARFKKAYTDAVLSEYHKQTGQS